MTETRAAKWHVGFGLLEEYCLSHTKKKLSILYAAIMEVLQCNTCQDTPLTPPAIFAKYCRRIVGCQACVDK